MSKVTAGVSTDRVSEDKRDRYVAIALNDIRSVINGGLSFADNFSAQSFTLNFPGAANILFAHNLGRVPIGYIVTKINSPAFIFDGTTPGTIDFFSLRSSAGCNVDILLY